MADFLLEGLKGNIRRFLGRKKQDLEEGETHSVLTREERNRNAGEKAKELEASCLSPDYVSGGDGAHWSASAGRGESCSHYEEGREPGALPFKGSVLQQVFSRGLLSARSRGRLLFKGIMKETKGAIPGWHHSRAFAFSVAAAKRLVL